MSTRLGVLAAALLVAACTSATPSPSPLPAGIYALPTVDTRSWQACAGVGTEATLRGDREDARIAWLVSRRGNTRVDVVFPLGFTARFEPDLEVLDAAGIVVAREGDHVDGGCVTGQTGSSPLLIYWMAGR